MILLEFCQYFWKVLSEYIYVKTRLIKSIHRESINPLKQFSSELLHNLFILQFTDLLKKWFICLV
jgi:hypothetical protein